MHQNLRKWTTTAKSWSTCPCWRWWEKQVPYYKIFFSFVKYSIAYALAWPEFWEKGLCLGYRLTCPRSLRNQSQRLKNLKGILGQCNNFCLKWSFLIIKENGINKKFRKFICIATISMIFILICVHDVTCVETQLSHSKFDIFVKNIYKRHKNL